jgi:hypothetical protein
MKSTNSQFFKASLTPAGDGIFADRDSGAIYVGLSVPEAKDNATENKNQNKTGVGVAVSHGQELLAKLQSLEEDNDPATFLDALREYFPEGKINLAESPKLAPLIKKYCVPENQMDRWLIEFGSLLGIKDTWIGVRFSACVSEENIITITYDSGAELKINSANNPYQAKLIYTTADLLPGEFELGEVWNHELGTIIEHLWIHEKPLPDRQPDSNVWVIPHIGDEIPEEQVGLALADPQRVTNKSP